MAGATPWKIEVVKRSDKAKGFQAIPRRWVVERTIAWINRCRRLAKDYENLNRSALGFIRLASIRQQLINDNDPGDSAFAGRRDPGGRPCGFWEFRPTTSAPDIATLLFALSVGVRHSHAHG
jgi:hypothetical protein